MSVPHLVIAGVTAKAVVAPLNRRLVFGLYSPGPSCPLAGAFHCGGTALASLLCRYRFHSQLM